MVRSRSKSQTHGTAPGTVSLDPTIAGVLAAMGQSPYVDLDALPIDRALPLVRFPVNT